MRKNKKPKHIAVVLDGNRRWAVKRGMRPWEGHKVGADKFEEFVDWCSAAGVKQISAYVLSTENLKRPRREVKEIMKIFMVKLREWLESDKLKKYQMRVNFFGNMSAFPSDMVDLMKALTKKTAGFTKMVINILVGYSGKFELMNAFNALMRNMKSGGVRITEKSINDNLLVRTPVDLVIRTGGQSRLSNLLMWQSAYADIYTTKTLWPDFTKRDFNGAMRFFANADRKFGL